MTEALLTLCGPHPLAGLFVSLLRINLAMGVAIALVLALRPAVRRHPSVP